MNILDKIMKLFEYEKEQCFCVNLNCRKNIGFFMKECIVCDKIFCSECFKNHICHK